MSLSSDSPDAKKPCKGILKSSSSFDKHSAASSVHRKSAKFDELNVLQTHHPPDKDYGHMKVDEPKTPYNYVESDDVDQLDAELLAERLRAADARSDAVSEEDLDDDDDEEEEEELTEEQKKRKLEFERRRKAHYNEFEAIKLARKLIEEDDEEDEDEDGEEQRSKATGSSSSSGLSTVNPVGAIAVTGKEETGMEIEEIEEASGRTAKTADSPVARLKPVSSSIILEECSEMQGPRSTVIALIMIVSICLMIFFIVCFTLLFYLLKRNDD
ncbi:protein phosphatase inhibitor 2 isoform X1 [Anopheles gambiae]|uniref:protein phosphatase inhibitor 2 isoform X1 n=1 Tax=Anopheles gambiae TaxID=7165 RepID=UPI002AC94126|nr:protein phosphatase inhibitor 2 isoform X1 [Anopheles gambiae]